MNEQQIWMRGKSKDLKKIMLYLHCTKNKPGLDRKIVLIQLFTYRCLFWRVSYWLVKFKFCWNKWTFRHLIFNYEVDVLFRRNFLDWKIEPIFKSTKQPKPIVYSVAVWNKNKRMQYGVCTLPSNPLEHFWIIRYLVQTKK